MCLQGGRSGFDPWVGKIPGRRERLPTPVFWPGEFQGLYSPWGHNELDTTERLSLSPSGWHALEDHDVFCVVAQSCPTLSPLFMGFSRQEHWSGLLFPSPGDLPNPRIEPRPPALQAHFLPSEPKKKKAKRGEMRKLS